MLIIRVQSIVVTEGKQILHTYVPPGSSIHNINSKIYDRNEDGDFDISHNTLLIAEMFLRKQQNYTENKVYPYVEMADFRPELFEKARRLATSERRNHPWLTLSDTELIKSTQLYQRDQQTGKHGFTLAAILLFGKDGTIRSAVPHYKTDCIKRIINVDRYDDREIVITNLFDAYEQIMAFIEKHLPDPFYLEGTQRVSLRDKIFREIVSNILIHREYMNGSPARLIIEADKITATNANRPHGFGAINLDSYEPFPKNPNLAAFFREIGRAEELGSGVRNLFEYSKAYTGSDPVIQEQDVFKIELAQPLVSQATTQAEKESNILEFCQTPRSRQEIMGHLGLKSIQHFRKAIIRPLLEEGKLALTKPDVPSSPNQKYWTTGQ